MRIFDKQPSNWRELQLYVSEVFKECGFDTAVEKEVETVRGNVEVDVYASKSDSYNSQILCECKYWSKSIPQTVVHAFRTLVSDFGASQGFITSKKGFQKGAYNATKNSNVILVTWEEFEDKMIKEWMRSVVERNYKTGRNLMSFESYFSYYGKKMMPELYAEKEHEFSELKNQLENIIFCSLREHYCDLITHEISLDQVHHSIRMIQRDLTTQFTNYKQLFDTIYNGCIDGISKIESLFDNKVSWASLRETWPGY